MKKLTVKDVELKGKLVFLRVDFNVPLKDGVIQDDTRIKASLDTINYLIENGARTVICSHLGRPKGERKPELSLSPVKKRLEELLKKEVFFGEEIVGEEIEKRKRFLKEGELLLLENIRFMAGETKNDRELSKELSKSIDVYVNDAFGASHREHASVYGIAEFVPIAVSGFLMEREIEYLSKALYSDEKPYTVILGGAKVKDKIPIIEKLMDKASRFLIGGGMAYTFIKAKGHSIGKSLFDEEHFEKVKEMMEEAQKRGVEFLLPEDHIAVKSLEEPQTKKYFSMDIEDDYMGVDIGEKTVKKYCEKILDSKLILWNGPMGVFEVDEFSHGTFEIAKCIAESSALSIVGGGDSASAVKKSGFAEKITHISTGGGASLEFLSGKELPGIKVLKDKE